MEADYNKEDQPKFHEIPKDEWDEAMKWALGDHDHPPPKPIKPIKLKTPTALVMTGKLLCSIVDQWPERWDDQSVGLKHRPKFDTPLKESDAKLQATAALMERGKGIMVAGMAELAGVTLLDRDDQLRAIRGDRKVNKDATGSK